MMKLLSVNVSLPKEVSYKGKTVRTGIYKEPVNGRIAIKKLNLEGDGQADLIGHGGEMRAVYVYSYDNYAPWAQELGRNDFSYGQFGENFTVQGMLDHEIHIGDQFKIGTAIFEVSQPRVPCYKLAMKMDVPDFYSRILKSGRLGFYFRVLTEGEVGAGDAIIPHKIQSPAGINISQINELMYFDKHNYEAIEKALSLKALSPGWSDTFKDRLAKKEREIEEQKAYQALRVSKIVEESETIRSYYLSTPDEELASFQAGQFLPIKLDIPRQYQSVYRTYTISNAPGESYYRLSIKREDAPADTPNAYPGVSSNYFHSHVQEGSEIMAAKPRGKFYLASDSRLPLVFISAGVGITPMISMLEALLAQQDPRAVYFIHGARNGKEHAFKEQIQAIQKNHPQVKACIAYSKPLDSDTLEKDYQVKGRLHLDIIKENIQFNPQANFYVCGPNRFMQDMLLGLKDWGVALDCLHFELFNSTSEQINLSSFLKAEQSTQGPSSSTFTFSFLDSNLEAPWDEAYENILEFAEAKGLSPDFSCRAGVCHTCTTPMTSGQVSYDPEPLQEPDPGEVLICCSKPTSNIQLKL